VRHDVVGGVGHALPLPDVSAWRMVVTGWGTEASFRQVCGLPM